MYDRIARSVSFVQSDNKQGFYLNSASDLSTVPAVGEIDHFVLATRICTQSISFYMVFAFHCIFWYLWFSSNSNLDISCVIGASSSVL